ncbi:MAG: helix-turn-helix domain-containing protein [Scytonema sp. PMC 1069.18]|nr:helix-turn-helix domain-containing protein [Scytonema sp. PMC 1069.18]MEC4885488.1 helix-turn-helix domain-containing protein [Scytonema sp. PMC 1070.18]
MSEKNTITVERLPDGRVVQVMPDGSKRLLQDKTDWVQLRAMTEEEIEAAAVADLDNPPLTDEELKKFRRVPDLKKIRQKLHMTQEQFAMKFHVPLGTLRDWEQGAKYPDTATRSYLRVIEKAPYIVMQALEE